MVRVLSVLRIPVSIFAVLAGAVFAIPAPASAASAPPTDASYYVRPSDTAARAQTLGCEQAKADDSNGRNSFVILDYGAQRKTGGGTYLAGTTVYWANSSDENYAVHFAYGYQSCGPRHLLILAVGTSNDGAVTDGKLGAVWGDVVKTVAGDASRDGYSNVAVQGAVDAEPGFGPFPHFQGWELGDSTGGGYVSQTKALLDDFGSADGCPQKIADYSNGKCQNGWTVADEYAAVWGWSPNEGSPEIYFDGCHKYGDQPNQWADISDYARHYGKGAIKFVGPLDQGNCLGPAQAWSEFQAALSRNGVPDPEMGYSMEIFTK